ncbi:MAG: ATP-binding protein [Endomicrobium sp.]|jgi:conjugal transfer ATP-binding protein TraC|nr:ATP-binding protein [Endomicrobium sp.]
MPEINPTLFRKIFAGSQLPPVYNLLNLWALEDGALIGLDLQFSNVYELTLPDLTLKSEVELEDFYSILKTAVHSLPDNVTVQFLTRLGVGDDEKIKAYNEITKPDNEIAKFIIKSKNEHLKSVFIERKKQYLVITTHDKEETPASKKRKASVKKAKDIDEAKHIRRISKLKETTDNFLSGVAVSGISARKLSDDEIIRMLYAYLNPSRAELIDKSAVRSDKTLRSQLVYNAVENNFDHVYIDGYYYRAVNMHIRPEKVNFYDLFNALERFSPDVDICMTLNAQTQESLEKKLHAEGSVAKNINNMSLFKKNYEAANKADAADEMIEEVKATGQKLYYYTLCIVLKDITLERLTTRVNYALQAFMTFGEAEGVIDDMNHLPLWLSILPNHAHLNFRKHIYNTNALLQSLPVFSQWKGCDKPRILFQTEDEQLLPIDLFDPSLSAKHGLVLGQTGSGKSFTTNFLLTNFYIESEKNHIVIIDVGGSYRKLCKLFGGQYFEVELSEKFAFNPFPSKEFAVVKNDETGYEIDDNVIVNISKLVQKMLDLANLSGKDQTILDRAIINTYKNSKHQIPLLGDLVNELFNYPGDEEDKRTAKDFGKNLEIWTSGRYGKIVNRHTTMSVNDRIVVFDLQKLGEDFKLQSIIFFLISSVIENKLKDKTLKKIIVIDEGWKFFNDEIGSMLIQNLYRTARKFNAGILSISQSPTDFLSTKAANAIISNSYVKYILRLKSGFELLEQFGLNAQEIGKVKNLRIEKGKYSEVFLKFSEYARVIRIEPSAVDYWICTTDPDDAKKEDDLRAKYPQYTEAQILENLSQGRKK